VGDWLRLSLVLVCLAPLVAGCGSLTPTPAATIADCATITYPSHGEPVRAYQCLPGVIGPWPAVIVLHGANGPGVDSPPFHTIAEGLAAEGFAALYVDYFCRTPPPSKEGFKPFSAEINRAWPVFLEVAGDAITYLGTVPGVDGKRVGLLGYSLGGYVSLALGAQDDRPRAIVEYYGGLPTPFSRRAGQLPPVLVLHGDADSTVPVAEAYALERYASAAGGQKTVEMQIYKGAEHSFNFQGRHYDPEAAKDAEARTLAFLRRWLLDTQ